DVINGMRYDVVGAVEMRDLCKVSFIGDLIEPLRNAKKRPDIKQLRKAVGEVDLDELYYLTYKQVMRSLVARDRYISPATLDIWNGLVKKHRNPALFKRRQGDPNVVL
ncbi:MAG: hypothetical protein MJ189_02055, partial [Coriobacteriales bacterium]|nr:hypothetical protein [Coriobacteriales bacterium]